MTIRIEMLSPALGAEVTGIDLREPVDDAARKTVLEAWYEHHLLVFPGQVLNDADHLRACEIFGAIQPERLNPHLADDANPAVHFVSNIREDGILPHGDIVFHMDQMQYDKPSQAMSLCGIDIPSKGGETKFSNSHLAYDALPDDVKKRLEGLRAENAYLYYSPNMMRKVAAREEEAPRAIHPVIRTHPVTGRKAIYVNRLLSDRIIGMDVAESDALLGILFRQIEEDRFIYEHTWRVGDVLVWDNRSLLHARNTYDSKNERRQLRRIAIVGDVPY
ncbi:MAG: TauD/TfdA family dioxygenase [Proteobacteria bacterium]|nr:TauD/TfdA family dioxygenase [Pseudomonadota bacterium]